MLLWIGQSVLETPSYVTIAALNEITNFSLGNISQSQNFKSLGKRIGALNLTFKDDYNDL